MRLDLQISEVLYRHQSRYQQVAIYRTAQFGRMLALDDVIMLTEADEFVYHELLVHPALLACPAPHRVLVVGGGDGGAVREVLRHRAVREVVLAELDEAVVAACRGHLPATAAALSDPRVRLHFGDGAAYVAGLEPGAFDAILIDAPDPVGHAQTLFSPEFCGDCVRALGPGGSIALQTDSPFIRPDGVRQAVQTLDALLPHVQPCWGVVPTYAGNLWTFVIGSRVAEPASVPEPARQADLRNCRYWSPRLHRAAFVLPAFVEGLVAGARDAHRPRAAVGER